MDAFNGRAAGKEDRLPKTSVLTRVTGRGVTARVGAERVRTRFPGIARLRRRRRRESHITAMFEDKKFDHRPELKKETEIKLHDRTRSIFFPCRCRARRLCVTTAS